MTSIVILDTGYNTSDRQGTANSGSDINSLSSYIANGGSALTIKCPRVRLRSGTNLADDPNPSSDDAARVHFTSFNNSIFEIDFIIDVTNDSDRSALKQIAVLSKTSGVKLFYATATSDTIKTLPELIGRTDTKFHGHEVTAGIPVIVGKVRGISIDQISTSRRFQITGTITFEEEKTESA